MTHDNQQLNHTVSAANGQPTPDPKAPRQPEFSPPGEQQTRHDKDQQQRREVPSMPTIREIPEKPGNPGPERYPEGPDPERA